MTNLFKNVEDMMLRVPKYDRYLVLVMTRRGVHHMEEVVDDPARKFYSHNGHRYLWRPGDAYRLLGWFPWQPVTMNPIKFLFHWVQRRLVSVGVLFFEELPDEPDESLLIEPLTHLNHVTKGYDRVHPKLFRGALLSPLYKRYNRVRFGAIGTSTKTLFLIFGAFAAVIIILWYAGVWG